MAKRRDNHPPVPMPATLPRDAWLVVVDEQGAMLGVELLPAGTDLPDRLAAEAAQYHVDGWTGDPIPGRWSFIVRKAQRGLVIGIRAAKPKELPP